MTDMKKRNGVIMVLFLLSTLGLGEENSIIQKFIAVFVKTHLPVSFIIFFYV